MSTEEKLVGLQYIGSAARPMIPIGEGRFIIFERDGDAVGCPEDFVKAVEEQDRDDFKVTGAKFARPYTEHPPEPEHREQALPGHGDDAAPAARKRGARKPAARKRGAKTPASTQQDDTPPDAGGADNHDDAGTGE